MTIGFLRKCSVTYLLLPNVLFAYGWFRQPYSLLMMVGLVYLLVLEYLKQNGEERLTTKHIFFLIIFAAVWTFFCGVDGLSTQSLDWLAHNSKFYDLYKNPWPNYFPEIDRSSCYYFGYYLVPALLSKVAGELLPSVIIIWTAIGFFLGLSWIFILVNRNSYLLLLIPFVRGTGQLVNLFLAKLHIYNVAIPIINPSLRSVFQQTLFATNQVIPALIVSGILLYDSFIRKQPDQAFLLLTLSFVWAVFPSIALVIIFGAVFLHKYLVQSSFKELFKMEAINNYLIPGLLFIPVFVYFLSSGQSADQGFIWNHTSSKELIFGFLTGIFLDVLIFYVLTKTAISEEKVFPFWFVNVLFGCILVMSLYYMGMFNDLFFRGSIPVFIMITTMLLRGIDLFIRKKSWPKSRIFYTAGFTVVALGILQITLEIHLLRDNAVTTNYLHGKTAFKKYPYDTCSNTYQTIKISWGVEGADEYLAAKNSLFEQYLGKRPSK